jgi:hypothetical protein
MKAQDEKRYSSQCQGLQYHAMEAAAARNRDVNPIRWSMFLPDDCKDALWFPQERATARACRDGRTGPRWDPASHRTHLWVKLGIA